jgi:hypothetical protein
VSLRKKTGEQGIAFSGSEGDGFAFARELIVTPGGPLIGRGILLRLPARLNQLITLEAPQRRIDRATGQSRDLHDIEAEAIAEADGLEDESRAVGEARRAHGYVVFYHE